MVIGRIVEDITGTYKSQVAILQHGFDCLVKRDAVQGLIVSSGRTFMIANPKYATGLECGYHSAEDILGNVRI